MSDDKLIDALTEAVDSWPNRPWLVLPGPTFLAPGLVRHIADTIRVAGYAIVKLPESEPIPVGDDDGYGHCVGLWDVPCGSLAAWSDDGSITNEELGEMTPPQARDLATALLAAADRAEREQ